MKVENSAMPVKIRSNGSSKATKYALYTHRFGIFIMRLVLHVELPVIVIPRAYPFSTNSESVTVPAETCKRSAVQRAWLHGLIV
ncbi:hypothetical protein IAQ61_003998 [Plenodomus lingam]|uniref:uncharacterized protein n=1 Tax=Leptosphaeria maculans TaxID=5022 RepID=UPI00332FCC3B|nr:hypothetical protein IAQ61_003998 [Plenodomus lingam]